MTDFEEINPSPELSERLSGWQYLAAAVVIAMIIPFVAVAYLLHKLRRG
jgi:uncharacterized membrane-anchored protein